MPLHFDSPQYVNGKDSIAAINIAASKDSNGTIHISFVNLNPNHPISISTAMTANNVSGQILTADKLTDINDFDKPAKVQIRNFTGFKTTAGELSVVLLPKSIVVLAIK